MQLPNTLQTLLTLATQLPSLGYFLELALKATLLLLLALLAEPLLRRRAAALRHLPWCLCLLALGFLLIFTAALPPLIVSYSAEIGTVPVAAKTAAETQALLDWWAALWTIVRLLYLSGMLLLMLYALSGLLRILLFTRAAQPSTNAQARLLLDGILAEELADIQVELREHPHLQSPLSWGLLHPVIILPTASRDWAQARLHHVLLHELGHVQRLDWVLHLFTRYVCALYWYHPLVWYARRRLGQLAEQACDDSVLLQDGQDIAYADDLVAVARSAHDTRHGAWLASFLAHSFLGMRVHAILDRTRQRQRNDSSPVILALLGSALGAALLGATELQPARAAYLPNLSARYIAVDFLPTPDLETPPLPVAHDKPQLLLSDLPAVLETIVVRRDPAPATLPGSQPLPQPRITMAELPGHIDGSRLRLLSRQFPEYPLSAKTRGIEGSITVEYTIDASGTVINPHIVDAQPRKVFDASALDTILRYRYDPPRLNGRPVAISGLRTRFVYQLDSDPG